MATKTQTSTEPAFSPARLQLQQTLEAQQRAIGLVDKAQKVVDAAGAAVEQARAESVKHDELAADSVKERLALLKGDAGAKTPDQLREARRMRLLAKEELTASDETLQVARQELEEARGNVLRSEKACNSHATAVIGECVTTVIAELDRVNQERERLRVILDSLVVTRAPLDLLKPEQQANVIHAAVSQAGLPMGDAADWRRLMDKCGGALSRNYAQQDPGPGLARAREYWAKVAGELMVDPTIEQAPPPSADVLFR
jgi:hypothetical protein